MSRIEVLEAMKPLRVLRGGPSTAEDLDVYVEQFQHADLETFQRGCARALKTRSFFPTPAELFSDCEHMAPRETWKAERPTGPTKLVYLPNPFGGEGIRIRVSEDSGHKCDECSDTGWSSAWCGERPNRQTWLRTVACGREDAHLSHEWVCPCGCWHTNPRLIAKRARTAQHARGGKSSGEAA